MIFGGRNLMSLADLGPPDGLPLHGHPSGSCHGWPGGGVGRCRKGGLSDRIQVSLMALGPRLDLRQTQSLVMTPQLQQAIKLLALSNLEIETFIGEALENNPLLEAGEMRAEDREAPPESEEQRLADSSSGDGDEALDIDPDALDRDRDTGDWVGRLAGAGRRGRGTAPTYPNTARGAPTLADHLDAQVGPAAPDARTAFIARHIVGLLDEAGYLATPLARSRRRSRHRAGRGGGGARPGPVARPHRA